MGVGQRCRDQRGGVVGTTRHDAHHHVPPDDRAVRYVCACACLCVCVCMIALYAVVSLHVYM